MLHQGLKLEETEEEKKKAEEEKKKFEGLCKVIKVNSSTCIIVMVKLHHKLLQVLEYDLSSES